MLTENEFSISQKTPDLLNALNSSCFKNESSKCEYENILVKCNLYTPQLIQLQNNFISEIQKRHVLISRVSVPPQYVYSILNQLFDLFRSRKYKFLNDKLLSAYTLPNDPTSIYLEGPNIKEILDLFSIFQSSFSLTAKDIIQFNDTSDIIKNVCNPLRTISLQIGKLIRITTPSFQNQIVQVLDFHRAKSQIIIKFCPRIDYDNLIQKGINSQIQLNNSMPPDYLAPFNIFQPEKLRSFIPSKEIRHKTLNLTWLDQPIICEFWDGNLFLGTLQCKKIDISQLIIMPFEISSEEIELFQGGLTQFEKDNETLIRNFRMPYDASYETIVQDLNILDSNYESKLDKLSEYTQNYNEMNNDLNESNKEFNLQKTSQEIISYDSHIQQCHKGELLLTNDKNQYQNFKVGDYVMSTIPLESIFLKIREINDNGIIKADFLNLPCIGNSTQFIKVSQKSVCRKVKSIYELKNRSDIYRVGDIVMLKNKEIGAILDTNDITEEFDFLNLENKFCHHKFSEIDDTIINFDNCRDFSGNKLFLNNKVFIQKGGSGIIMTIYDDYALVKIDKEETFQFYKSKMLLLNQSDLKLKNDQMENSSKFDSNYNNNKQDKYDIDYDYEYDYHRSKYDNCHHKNRRKYYNSRYSNRRNKYEDNYNHRSRSRHRHHDDHRRYDDYNRFDDHNEIYRIHTKDPSNIPESQSHSQNELSKSPLIKSSDNPIWAQNYIMVTVPDDTKEAVIINVKNYIAFIQFIDKETKRLILKQHQYPIKDLEPIKIQEGDKVICYSETKPIYGKVKRITGDHAYLEEEKEKPKNKSKNFKSCVPIKDIYRYFDWDSLED